jgi:hypothetical protein
MRVSRRQLRQWPLSFLKAENSVVMAALGKTAGFGDFIIENSDRCIRLIINSDFCGKTDEVYKYP